MKKSAKLLISILIILTLFNFIMPLNRSVFADDYSEFEQKANSESEATQGISLGGILSGIGGIVLTPVKFLVVLPGMIANGITKTLGSMAGTESGSWDISLYHIFFNKLGVTDINILEFKWGSQMQQSFNSSDAFYKLRTNIANWYYAIRNLALVILLIVLIYVGIRMAMSTVAEDQAKYKTMLKDWFVALVLVFVLQYIILIVLNINNVLVSALDPGETAENSTIIKYGAFLLQRTFMPSLTNYTMGFDTAIIYTLLAAATFGFLLLYIKRMITIAFLTLIAPIITITYPIDKMGDGKAQALNKWLKEFMFNVLIQPFHCLLFLIFVQTSFAMINGTLAGGIFAVITIWFIYQAEGIIKKIFGFGEASTLGDSVKYAATLMAGANLLKGIGGGGNKNPKENETAQPQPQAQQPQTGTNNQNANAQKNNQGVTSPTNTQPVQRKPGNASVARSFRRNLGSRAGRMAWGGTKKMMKLGAGIGGAALGLGAGKGAIDSVMAGVGVGTVASGIGNLGGKGIRHMSAANRNRRVGQTYSGIYNSKGEAYADELVNKINADQDGSFKATLKGKEAELAERVDSFKVSLDKLGYNDKQMNKTVLETVEKVKPKPIKRK